jgi:hypothetical protein
MKNMGECPTNIKTAKYIYKGRGQNKNIKLKVDKYI